MKAFAIGLSAALAAAFSTPAWPAEAAPHAHHLHGAAPAAAPSLDKDGRQFVKYPSPLRLHTLASMRDHLATLGEIQAALASHAFDKASELAEQRLGMSSLKAHGAHEVAKYMPAGMQAAGAAMHHSASQLAIVAKDASVTGDLKPVLASLARLNQTCVACHAAYRLQ